MLKEHNIDKVTPFFYTQYYPLILTHVFKDVFVGFATVPGYVSLTATGGSPYLQVAKQVSMT